MGFLSDIFGSSNHSQTTSSTSTSQNTQLAGGNVSGTVAYGGSTVIQTDQGTVLAATDIAKSALALGAQEAATGSAVAIAGLAHAADAYTSSLSFASHLSDVTGGVVGKAMDSVDRFGGAALDANTYVIGKSLDSVNQAYANAQITQADTNAKALNSVEALASQTAQSAQQNTNSTIVKVAAVAAVALIGYAMYRRAA